MYNWKKSEGTSAILSILKFVLTSQTHAGVSVREFFFLLFFLPLVKMANTSKLK